MEMVSHCLNKQSIVLLVLLGACSSGTAANADFILEQGDFSTTAIVLPEKSDSIKRFAAIELKKHLRLITGHEFPITDKIEKASKALSMYDFYEINSRKTLNLLDKNLRNSLIIPFNAAEACLSIRF